MVVTLYCFYEKHQDAERLFKLATEQQDVILFQNKAIEKQEMYIKLLENQFIDDYYKKNSINSPIYD